MASSHKRETARRKPKAALIAGPLALLATGVTVAVGVLGSQPATTLAADSAQADLAAVATPATAAANRPVTISRSFQRPTTPPALKPKPKPKPVVETAPAGLDFSPCGDMSVTHGLVPDMIRAYEAVCNAFPAVTSYGGLGNRPEHNTGHAVDAMVYGDRALGQQIADFLQSHASELNLYDIIWYQHIWTPVRSSEGWRLMPNRGSATANHMDHVHFAVN